MLKKNKWLFTIILLGSLSIVGYHYFFANSPQQSNTDLVQTVTVKVSPVLAQSMPQSIHAYGGLRAVDSATLSSEISAVVKNIQFNEGDKVAQNTILVLLDKTSLEASLKKAESEEKLKKIEYARQLALFKKKVISASELDKAKNDWESKKADVQLAQVSLDKATISAPFSGRLGLKQVSVGDFVSVGKPIVEIVNTEHLKLTYNVPEQYYNQIKLGQKVHFKTSSAPEETFTGEVSFIAPKLSTGTRMVTIEADIDNQDGRLAPGFSGSVSHLLKTVPNVLTVPEASVLSSIEGESVFVVKEKNGKTQAQKVLIEAGLRSGGYVPVTKGIEQTDRVVTEGHQKIRDGQFVDILTKE